MARNRLIGQASARAHPSLALTKYWGKLDTRRNIPATPSLALGLAELTCDTEVEIFGTSTGCDAISINGISQNPIRFEAFFHELRRRARAECLSDDFAVHARSSTNFPVAAGAASSSAGFAALALSCVRALSLDLDLAGVSALARLGSASAARSLFGGFTCLPAGAECAMKLYDAAHWPQLRVVVILTDKQRKAITSRDAMERCRLSSPYYESWLNDAEVITAEALEALKARRIDLLGPLVRQSYMRMFAVMFGARPPIRFWSASSLEVLDMIDGLRQEGYQFWETMDAGPQVKVFCEDEDCRILIDRIKTCLPGVEWRLCTAAKAPQVKGAG